MVVHNFELAEVVLKFLLESVLYRHGQFSPEG